MSVALTSTTPTGRASTDCAEQSSNGASSDRAPNDGRRQPACSWQIDRIAITLQTITDRIEHRAREHDLQPLRARDRGSRLLAVGVPAYAMQRVPERLTDRNVHVGVRAATGLRISPHRYTTDDDLPRFYDAFSDALAA